MTRHELRLQRRQEWQKSLDRLDDCRREMEWTPKKEKPLDLVEQVNQIKEGGLRNGKNRYMDE